MVQVVARDAAGRESVPSTAYIRLTPAFDFSFTHSASVEDNVLNRESAAASKEVYGFLSDGALRDRLERLGFENVEAYDFGGGHHTAGGVMASRTVCGEGGEEIPLYAIIVRGTMGANEWISNFTVGISDLHEGFSSAAERVWSIFNTYAAEYTPDVALSGTGYKVWITGHSRGAAIGNILAAYKFAHNADNVYAYLYATPNIVDDASASYRSAHYAPNIFNYVIAGDLIPRMPPIAWGFTKAGRIITFENENQLYGSKVLTGDQMGEFMRFVTTLVPDRDAYFNTVESSVQRLIVNQSSNQFDINWLFENGPELMGLIIELAPEAIELSIWQKLIKMSENPYLIVFPLLDDSYSVGDVFKAAAPAHDMGNYRKLIEENYKGR